jgi:hypothetical protein
MITRRTFRAVAPASAARKTRNGSRAARFHRAPGWPGASGAGSLPALSQGPCGRPGFTGCIVACRRCHGFCFSETADALR